MARRVDRDGALHILGVGVRAFDNYRRTDPTFPKPGPRNGTYAAAELRAWKAARPKPARGSMVGQAKPKGVYPCERCGTEVPRRWKFKPTTDPADDELLCKPCLVVAVREAGEGK